MKDVAIAFATLSADIDDYMDENVVDDADVTEIDARMEEYGSSYRLKDNELRQLAGNFYEEMFSKAFNSRIKTIKEYIRYGKDLKRKLTKLVENNKAAKERSCSN